MKRIDIQEFREKGYLQEANRRFFHPLGLALEIILDDNGSEKLGGILDYRDHKQGIYFDIQNSDEERHSKFKKNKEFIDKEFTDRLKNRENILGFGIEKID